MSEKSFLTIPKQVFFLETVVNKSRFLAYALGVENPEEANDFLTTIRKKHYDATHNCYAYIIGNSIKFSDDGEPSGTAGKPILNVLQQKGFADIIVVVTRYFGGIKLGAGGLVRAYGGAAADLLATVPTLKFLKCVDVEVSVAYNALRAVVSVASKFAIKYTTDFDSKIRVNITVKAEDVDTLFKAIENTTNGKAEIQIGDGYIAKV